MERLLSDEEKIKRAEEIYNRRKNINVTVPSNAVNKRNNSYYNYKNFKKVLFKILIATIIYFIIYFIKCSNVFLANTLIKEINKIISYDINFYELIINTRNYLKNNHFFNNTFFSYPVNNNTINDTEFENLIFENIIQTENINIENQNENNEENNTIETSNIVTTEDTLRHRRWTIRRK